jgi:hypothetical protein
MVPVPEFLTVGWILSQFGKSRSAALAGYRAFVREGLESRAMGEVNRANLSWKREFHRRTYSRKQKASGNSAPATSSRKTMSAADLC